MLVGNDNLATVTLGINPIDSGQGAMALTCDLALIQQLPFGSDCSIQDYSEADHHVLAITTGTGATEMINHCAGTGSPPAVVPTFDLTGENLDCENWTTENGPGTLALLVPSEEPSPLATGDIPTGFLLVDASPSGAFLDGATGVVD